jgi:ribose transport system ATP-binding protein
VETLSGGNQQKVVLGRWLKFSAQILILEEPTIGVDVGARADIYRLIASALESGLTVLMLSTDLEEVENISHRALVFNRGRIVAELEDDSLTMSELVRTSSGG